jgi:hypothetical protein
VQVFLKLFLFSLLYFNYTIAQDQNPKPISKEIYLSYIEYPKRVFTGQKFKVKIQALIVKSTSEYDDKVTTLSTPQNLETLTQNIKWDEKDDGTLTTTLKFKAYDQKFVLPVITLALLNKGQVVSHATLQPVDIQYEKIAVHQKLFSNIIASNIKINSVKTKQYSNTQLHSTINIEGYNSNLEDIYLSNYEEQGTSSLTQNQQKQNLYYYVITPLHIKQIDFSYYNTKENAFVRIQLPIILEEELVSTQTELNPYHNSMLLYKQIAVGVLLVIFLLIYLFKRGIISLVVITFLIVLLTYLFIPSQKVLLGTGIKVYILPTSNSTVYKTLQTKQIVERIVEKNGFTKVIFKNDNVGWVKTDDIQ